MPTTTLMAPVTALFASLLALYYIKLAFDVIRLRKRHRVSLGSGGVEALERAIRAHGNFAEYVPLGLLLMALLEINGGSSWLVSGLVALLGSTLALGRALHATALRGQGFKRRVAGMMLTFGTLTALAAGNLVAVLYGISR